jgi:mannose-6-phosphate isomerase-like protein (cupin superfamily)
VDHVALDGLVPDDDRAATVRRLEDALGTTGLALAHYHLAPGERFSGSLHTHRDQSELFVVLDGTATFEWRPAADAPSETVTVGAGQAIRFAPGEFQSGGNDGSTPVVALAVGVPRETTDLEIARVTGAGEVVCPDCGHGAAEPVALDGRERLRCVECGAAFDVDEGGGHGSG